MARVHAKGTNTRTHFTHGDFYKPGDYFEATIRQNATAYFLAEIARNHRHVVRDLKATMLLAYRSAVQGLRESGRFVEAEELSETWRYVQVVQRPRRLDELLVECPSLQPLKESLDRWAARWGLDLPRLADTALATVAAWHGDDRQARRLLWNHHRAVNNPEPMVPTAGVQFTVNAWSPRAEPEAIARRRIQESLLRQIDKYLADVKADRRREGWIPAPTKVEIETHAGWLAAYQVEGISIRDIARGNGATPDQLESDRKQVAAGIESVGRLIAGDDWLRWRRKPTKGGRPKKTG